MFRATLIAQTILAAAACGADINSAPLPLKPVVAFENLQWVGWSPEGQDGAPTPLRPILVTHAGDGSNRIFAPTQQGVIHVFPNRADASKAEVFLDMASKVAYNDKTNEEGFLGLAFHPRFKSNGQFFVYYTNQHKPHQNVISRYRVDASDPNRADPKSEEILLVLDKPFWNHDGGTICFGPDGFLYVAVGDGGLANDPFNNGQNLKTLLGKILRLDVDRAADGRAYAIPADNPFVKDANARPEIYAYGLRNVWRMAFDRKTGILWAGDVGQDIWEEIDLIVRGGNYGWNLREATHPFGKNGSPPRADLIEPVWEYHHDVGKSITGGVVYRGARLPELAGAYLYADYVSGKFWALWYDEATKKVVANRPIPAPTNLAALSFGEDEEGEVYFTIVSPTGKGLYRFERAEGAAGQ